MNTGGLFQPDMLLQMMQRDEELVSLFIVIKMKNPTLVFRNIRTSSAQNEINPHLTKEMMLLYIQMFTKLGDEFGAQLLEGDREKHIKRYRYDVFYGLSVPEK